MSDDEPRIREIHEVKMYNPETGEDDPIETIDFKGIMDIFEHDDIVDRRENGWVVRGFSADVDYKKKRYEVTVAGNNRMGYVKLSDIAEYEEGEELIGILRSRFREHFGFR